MDAGAGVATGGGGLGEHPGYLKVAEHRQEWGDSSAVADEAASKPGGREVQPLHAGQELRETEQLGAALHAAEDTDVCPECENGWNVVPSHAHGFVLI